MKLKQVRVASEIFPATQTLAAASLISVRTGLAIDLIRVSSTSPITLTGTPCLQTSGISDRQQVMLINTGSSAITFPGSLASGVLSAAPLILSPNTVLPLLYSQAISAWIPSSGTLGYQNSEAVDINGGAIDGTIIGAATPAAVTGTSVVSTATTPATSSTTGAMRTSGGMGVAGSLYVGGDIFSNENQKMASIVAESNAPVTNTGNTTENIIYSVPIPANTYGANTTLNLDFWVNFATGTSTKTVRVRIGGIGGTIICQQAIAAATRSGRFLQSLRFVSATSQRGMPIAQNAYGVFTTVMNTYSLDFTVPQTLVITCQNTSGADNVTFNGYTLFRN